MMKLSHHSLAFAGLATLVQAAKHELVVGTFVSKNLYTLSFDDQAFTLDLVANISVPVPSSWIALSHDKKHLYGTDYEYIGQSQGLTQPPVYVSYTIHDASNITLDKSLSAKQGCNGTSIYLIANHNAPYTVYGADFWGTPGCGTVMSVDEHGALEEVIQDFEYLEEKSSIHGLALSPDSDLLYSADTYGNNVWTHAVSKDTGLVTEVLDVTEGPSAGSNPRHVAIHRSGKALYAITEGSNQVVWYKIDRKTGIPHVQEPIYSLLPSGFNNSLYWGDAVSVTPSGNYLWATTRARSHDDQGYISAFELAKNGSIKRQMFLVPTTSSGGVANAVTPSDFDDRFVAVTDNSEGFVEIWALDGGKKKCSAKPVARIDLADQGNSRYKSGCCANAVWLS